ncbi:MAG: hypothetical protein V4617_07640 [Gemmatimonadota bacterium]
MTHHATRWVVPQTALDRSYDELAADGARGREGIALWAGTAAHDAHGQTVCVTHVLLLRGAGVERGPGYIGVSPELLNDVTDVLAALGGDVYLVGQIHGHPPRASTDLSEVDVAYGIRTPGFLSVVAPNYGMARVARLAECGVHVFDPRTGWQRVKSADLGVHVNVPASSHHAVASLTVGEAIHG